MKALISVYDKAGIVDFARSLQQIGIEIVSTGGTYSLLKEEGITVKQVSEITGSPEILGGRVKTLHPVIHGGILAKRDDKGHQERPGSEPTRRDLPRWNEAIGRRNGPS